MTNFRALCAELVDALDSGISTGRICMSPLANRARAALAEQPVGPTDEELRELWQNSWDTSEEQGAFQFARAVLARWGQPAAAPVPVSERLPGPEGCLPWPGAPDETHWCWVFIKSPLDDDSWERRPVSCLTPYRPMYTHWLPAHSLPVPGAEDSR